MKVLVGLSLFLSWMMLYPGLTYTGEKSGNASFQLRMNLRLGDKYYDSREVPENLEKSHAYYISVLEADPENQAVLWRLSRSFRTLGVRALQKKKQLMHLSNAIKYGERAVKVDSENYQTHLWFGISMGSYALAKGVMESLNLKDKIKFELGEVLKQQPNNIRARLALAHWYFYLPEWLDGDKTKAMDYADQAIIQDPNYTRSYLLKARLLKDWGKMSEARRALQQVMKIQTPSEVAAAVEDKAEARKILQVLQ